MRVYCYSLEVYIDILAGDLADLRAGARGTAMEETGAVGKYARGSFIAGFRNEDC